MPRPASKWILVGGKCLGQPPSYSSQYRAGRELPHYARGGLRRVRHHLRGRGHEPRHHGRHQGVLPGRVRRSRPHDERAAQIRPSQSDVRMGPLQLPAGGAHAGALRASEHRARHARVRDQLHCLHGDALRGGAELRELADPSRSAADARGARRGHGCSMPCR
jgi:hypothetical protein